MGLSGQRPLWPACRSPSAVFTHAADFSEPSELAARGQEPLGARASSGPPVKYAVMLGHRYSFGCRTRSPTNTTSARRT